MALPPVSVGAVHDTVAKPLPAVAVAPAGAAGAVAGVTDEDGSEGELLPLVLAAMTVKVYGVPFVSPFTVQVVAGGVPVAVHPALAGDEDTV
jgi:hypothetical protein